jgi:hypothetical protein
MIVKVDRFRPADLERFLELQRRSFAILEETAAGLHEGVTEKEVARELVLKYRAAGARAFFHLPVALFGERTALPGDWKVGKFFPKDRKLAGGDAVILDAAPLFGGYMVDTSYSFSFGENPGHRKMMTDLSRYRSLICNAVNAGRALSAIAAEVAHDMRSRGYEPAHQKHPGEVLGHRAIKTAVLPFAWRIQGFDGLSLAWFLLKSRAVGAGLGRRDPLWNGKPASDHPPHDGLWLVEPHAGVAAYGAKWEEILVIETGRARWLDDAPPHVRQWREIDAGRDYAPRPVA